MADVEFPTQDVSLTDDTTGQKVTIVSDGGQGRMLTDATVSVEQTLGFDNYADQWIVLTSIGNAGDTIRFQIEGGASGDVTITRTATEDTLSKLAIKIVNSLNADATFRTRWTAKAFNQVVFIIGIVPGELGEAPNAGDVIVTVSGTITFNQDTFHDRVIRRNKTALLTPDFQDNRVGVLGVQGEVSSVLKAGNPIFFNIQRILSTATETEFLDLTVPTLQTYFISQVIGASELDSKFVVYRGFFRDYVQNITGTVSNDYILDYECMPTPFQGSYWSVTVGGVPNTNFEILDDPNDDKKSILRYTGAGNLDGQAIVVTYDAVDRIIVGFIQKPSSAIVPLQTPLKLEEGEFVIVTIKNRSNNAGEATVSLIGFFEEEVA